MRRALIATVSITTFLLAGCGGDEESETAEPAETTTSEEVPEVSTVHNASDIAAHIGVELTDTEDATWTTADGAECDLPIFLTTAQEVDLYAGAGDTVATNPAGTAGVKIVGGEQATCLDELTEALADFE